QSAGTLAAGVLQVDAAGPVALGSWNAVQALGAIDVEGNLLLRNTPAITQTALGSITVEGAATFASGGAITLANAGNRFDGVVNLAGGAARIQTSGALRLGDLDVASLEAESHDDLDLGQGSIGGALVADSN